MKIWSNHWMRYPGSNATACHMLLSADDAAASRAATRITCPTCKREKNELEQLMAYARRPNTFTLGFSNEALLRRRW